MNLRDENNLVTRIEFAHEIGVSETTISKWIKRGIVPAPGIRIGLRKYWEPEELNTVKKKIMRRDDWYGKQIVKDDDPTLKPKDLQEKMRVSDRHARRIVSGHKAAIAITPKLLNHGGKRDEQLGYDQVASKGGMTKTYVIARLDRDGHTELAEQVRSGSKSARKAAIEAGFKVPESPLTLNY